MISALELENFRNFANRGLSFTERTFISGANGIGKSTVLEAIRVLSVGRSFRSAHLEELIRRGEKYCRVRATLLNGSARAENKEGTRDKREAEFFYGSQFSSQETKDHQLTFQGKALSWTDFLGVFPTVLFTPNDLDIVLGAPNIRRKYLDSILWQVSAEYRRSQLEFWQVLRERSALLFMIKINRASSDELQPWNELISKLTQAIRSARLDYVGYLNGWFEARINNQNSRVSVTYLWDQKPIEYLAAQEIKSAQNLFGAHRDELIINYDDFSARRFASRGQSRLTIAYFKAAEADYLARETNNPVAVLLDDAASELDAPNTRTLLELFDENHQLILTSANQLELGKDWERIEL